MVQLALVASDMWAIDLLKISSSGDASAVIGSEKTTLDFCTKFAVIVEKTCIIDALISRSRRISRN